MFILQQRPNPWVQSQRSDYFPKICENPVLKHSGKGWEYDQTADPSPIITPDGGELLYYDADNNVNGEASIGMAIAKQELIPTNRDLLTSEIDVTIELFQ